MLWLVRCACLDVSRVCTSVGMQFILHLCQHSSCGLLMLLAWLDPFLRLYGLVATASSPLAWLHCILATWLGCYRFLAPSFLLPTLGRWRRYKCPRSAGTASMRAACHIHRLEAEMPIAYLCMRSHLPHATFMHDLARRISSKGA